MDFKNYINNIVEFENNTNLTKYILDSSKIIFDLIKHPNKEIQYLADPHNMQIGRFYLIKYSYGGNKIWCPTFTIDFRVNLKSHKEIAYAMNLDYFPPIPKINFFDNIFQHVQDTLTYNKNKGNVAEERRFKDVTFEIIYRLLQKYTYTITAFNLAKIQEVYLVSTNIAHRFLLMSTINYNAQSMKNLYENLNPSAEKDAVQAILKEYNRIVQEYSNYNDDYYKKLSNFEERLKIIGD